MLLYHIFHNINTFIQNLIRMLKYSSVLIAFASPSFKPQLVNKNVRTFKRIHQFNLSNNLITNYEFNFPCRISARNVQNHSFRCPVLNLQWSVLPPSGSLINFSPMANNFRDWKPVENLTNRRSSIRKSTNDHKIAKIRRMYGKFAAQFQFPPLDVTRSLKATKPSVSLKEIKDNYARDGRGEGRWVV